MEEVCKRRRVTCVCLRGVSTTNSTSKRSQRVEGSQRVNDISKGVNDEIRESK